MSRSLFAALAVVVAAGLAIWIGERRASVLSSNAPSPPAPTSTSASPSVSDSHAPPATASPSPMRPADEEAMLMLQLRKGDPATTLALARDGNRRYPGSSDAEE